MTLNYDYLANVKGDNNLSLFLTLSLLSMLIIKKQKYIIKIW